MRKWFVFFLLYFAVATPIFSQEIPSDIEGNLVKYKKEAKLGLYYFRTKPDSGHLYTNLIQWVLPDKQSEIAMKMRLKLHLGMLYDDQMRNRIVQLLKNEYRQDELDTLVNRDIKSNISYYEWKAMGKCKLDTSRLFKHKLMEYYNEEKKNNPKNYMPFSSYTYDVFKLLKMDTLAVIRTKVDSNIKVERKIVKSNLLNQNVKELSFLAELCGYINDKRFVKPLIAVLGKTTDDYERSAIYDALIRMKVEPYYTTCLKENSRSGKEIAGGKGVFFYIFKDLLRSQQSFLELSKYLMSNDDCNMQVSGDYPQKREHGDEVKYCVFVLIYNNLDNEDLKILVGNGVDKIQITEKVSPEVDAALVKMYVWMQKNYGKYKISWYEY